MLSLVLKAPKSMSLEERPVPLPGPAEILIRVGFASICHTDFFVINGEYRGTNFPTVLGHEFSGVIEQCGQGVSRLKRGDRVTAMSYSYCGECTACRQGRHIACRHIKGIPFTMEGAFQEMIVMPSVSVYPIADSLHMDEAALTEPCANGYSAAERAGICPGDTVVVIGPGPIGIMAMQSAALHQPGSLIMLGTRTERLELAGRLGASITVNVHQSNPYDVIMDITRGKGADVVLFCGGDQDAWELAGRILAPYGRVIVEALPATYETRWPVPVFDFTAKNISYLGTCGYTAAQFETALKLIELGRLNVASLITHRFALADYQEAFETVEKRKGGVMKVLFTFET